VSKLSLPTPGAKYDPGNEAQMRAALEANDAQNIKLGQVLDKFFMRDTATGHIKTVVITSGAFVIT
jgi:hypothetical protein